MLRKKSALEVTNGKSNCLNNTKGVRNVRHTSARKALSAIVRATVGADAEVTDLWRGSRTLWIFGTAGQN
jgi:hypothetical protein